MNRVGRPEVKRKKSITRRQRGDTGQSTEQKKGRVDCGWVSEGADVSVGVREQCLEVVEPSRPYSETGGAAPDVGEEVEIMGSDIGFKKSDDMQEDEGELSDSLIISDIAASQIGDFIHLRK